MPEEDQQQRILIAQLCQRFAALGVCVCQDDCQIAGFHRRDSCGLIHTSHYTVLAPEDATLLSIDAARSCSSEYFVPRHTMPP